MKRPKYPSVPAERKKHWYFPTCLKCLSVREQVNPPALFPFELEKFRAEEVVIRPDGLRTLKQDQVTQDCTWLRAGKVCGFCSTDRSRPYECQIYPWVPYQRAQSGRVSFEHDGAFKEKRLTSFDVRPELFNLSRSFWNAYLSKPI